MRPLHARRRRRRYPRAITRSAIADQISLRVYRFSAELRAEASAELRRADALDLELGFANGAIETANERITALFVWSCIATVLVGLLAAFAAVLTLYVIDLRHALTVQTTPAVREATQ